MFDIEEEIYNEVSNNNRMFIYKVTPIYMFKNDIVPIGIIFEYETIDKGDKISHCKFCYNIEKGRTLNIVFDEHFRISDVHGMDEKVYGGQTMSKRKLLTVILLAFVTTLMLACAIIFT